MILGPRVQGIVVAEIRALEFGASFEVTFNAVAGEPYRLWLRGRAAGDSYRNDSVWVHQHLHLRPLFEDEHAAIVAPDHRFARQPFVRPEDLAGVVGAFQGGVAVQVGDSVPATEYVRQLGQLPTLRAAAEKLGGSEPPALAAAVEFVLEGLHLNRKLNKDVQAGRARYRG